MTTTKGSVVVAVDGTDAGLTATRYAALAAQAADAELEVLHVVPIRLPVGPVRPTTPALFDDVAQEIVEDAAVTARVAAPGLRVRTHLAHGATVGSIVAAGRDADVVVLGAQRVTGPRRIWTGRTTSGVAARATVPVVVVPPEWEPGARHGRVVVGYKVPEGAPGLLGIAFAEADRRGAELVVVHAWKLPSAYDDVIGARVAEDEFRARAHAEMEPLVADLRLVHPDVPVSIEVLHADPARALVDASRDADLIVLTRPTAHHTIRHLGSTARTVLHASTCPVVVAPVDVAGAPTEPLVLERAGAMLR
jgi:nucleotide-binding universal stress UspA family protein